MKKLLRNLSALLLLIFSAFYFAGASFAANALQEEVAAAGDFVKKLQILVAEGKKRELAKLVSYPLTVNGKKSANNEDAFVQRYDEIFTENVQTCLRDHNLKEATFSRNGQYMAGWGCIWFFPVEKGGMIINAVNTQ
jgi:hypothetical protein